MVSPHEELLAEGLQLVRSYERRYRLRAERRPDGSPFGAPESDALASLVRARLAGASQSRSSTAEDLKSFADLTRPAFRTSHSVATDIAGYAWSVAFRAFRLSQPPSAQLEYTVTQGSAPGAVGGLWRALVCAVAVQHVGAAFASQAEAERERWTEYVLGKVSALDVNARDPSTLSVLGRAGYLLAELTAETGRRAAGEAARRLTATVLKRQDADGRLLAPDGKPALTAHVAQAALALSAVGRHGEQRRALRWLLAERGDGTGAPLRKDDSAAAPFELSPRGALAFVGLADEAHLGPGRARDTATEAT